MRNWKFGNLEWRCGNVEVNWNFKCGNELDEDLEIWKLGVEMWKCGSKLEF